MRKILIFAAALLLPLVVLSQPKKIALLETLNGDKNVQVKGIELNMVRGELRKAISNQAGFQAFTRTDVDQLMKEHGFQNSGMVSDSQRKRLGEMSGADYICVSTLTKNNTEFYLEAYLINVETGEISNPASQYGILEGGTYANLFQICQSLAQELIGNVGSETVVEGPPWKQSKKRSDLLSRGFVDLGLPSGTLWKSKAEKDQFTYSQAMELYGSFIPGKGQWEELVKYCEWEWIDKGEWEWLDEDVRVMSDGECGYRITGRNGNSIYLIADGRTEIDETNGAFENLYGGGAAGIWGFYMVSSMVFFYFGYDPSMNYDSGFETWKKYYEGFPYSVKCQISVVQAQEPE